LASVGWCLQITVFVMGTVMSLESRCEAGVSQVRFSNQADLSDAAELKAMLLELLSPPATALTIDLSEVSELHVSILQLLWAAAHEAQVRKVTCQILQPEDHGVLDGLVDIGLSLPSNVESTQEPAA